MNERERFIEALLFGKPDKIPCRIQPASGKTGRMVVK